MRRFENAARTRSSVMEIPFTPTPHQSPQIPTRGRSQIMCQTLVYSWREHVRASYPQSLCRNDRATYPREEFPKRTAPMPRARHPCPTVSHVLISVLESELMASLGYSSIKCRVWYLPQLSCQRQHKVYLQADGHSTIPCTKWWEVKG